MATIPTKKKKLLLIVRGGGLHGQCPVYYKPSTIPLFFFLIRIDLIKTSLLQKRSAAVFFSKMS
jgi:hypothetical protein